MHGLLTLAFLHANLLPPPPMQLPVDGVDIAAQVGVSSETAACAGLNGAAFADVLLSASDSAQLLSEIAAARATADSWVGTIATLQNSLAPGDAEGAAQLSAAKEELAEANAEVGVLLDQLFSDSTATLSGPQVATLAIARESVARNVLPQYRVLELSQSEWIAVEAALRAQRRAQRTGEPMPEAASSLLQVLNTNPLVTAAAAALELNMPEIDALVNAPQLE